MRNLPSIPAGQIPILDEAARNLIRKTYQKVGITITAAPEEEFLVGKAA